MKKTLPLSFRLDPEVKERLQRLADQDRRTITNLIEKIILDWLDEKDPPPKGKK